MELTSNSVAFAALSLRSAESRTAANLLLRRCSPRVPTLLAQRAVTDDRPLISSRAMSGLGMTVAAVCIAKKRRAVARKCRHVATRAAADSSTVATLSDGRSYRIFDTDADVGDYICSRVQELASASISSKGAFSLSIGSGTTVAPLEGLKDCGLDFSKFHVFFGNDRTERMDAGKCFKGAQAFVAACGIPSENVHGIPNEDPVGAAEEYEKLIKSMPSDVVGRCERSDLPSLDLILLGTGADGHTASLYPESPQVEYSPSNRMIVPAYGKGGVTATLHYINSARNVILSAAKPEQAEMVTLALKNSEAAANMKCPAGMVAASAETGVEWLLTKSSSGLMFAA